MSSFTTPLELIFHGKGRFELARDFEYHVGQIPSDDVVVVPKGFITDFASIPRVFWSFFPPTGSYGKAAVVHDWLLVEGKRPRKECDKIFLEAMKVDKVNSFTRNIIFWGVRIYSISLTGDF